MLDHYGNSGPQVFGVWPNRLDCGDQGKLFVKTKDNSDNVNNGYDYVGVVALMVSVAKVTVTVDYDHKSKTHSSKKPKLKIESVTFISHLWFVIWGFVFCLSIYFNSTWLQMCPENLAFRLKERVVDSTSSPDPEPAACSTPPTERATRDTKQVCGNIMCRIFRFRELSLVLKRTWVNSNHIS